MDSIDNAIRKIIPLFGSRFYSNLHYLLAQAVTRQSILNQNSFLFTIST